MSDQGTKPGRRYWLIMARGILRFMAVLVGMFLLAGRLSYWQAWGYGGMGLLLGLTVAVLFVRKPDVIQERVRPGPGMRWWGQSLLRPVHPQLPGGSGRGQPGRRTVSLDGFDAGSGVCRSLHHPGRGLWR